MFRFTIRELLILTVTAGLAVGWWIDHKELSGAAFVASDQARIWESRSNLADENVEEINKQLHGHGLALIWFCGESGTRVGVTSSNSVEENNPGPDLDIPFDQSAFASGSPQQ